MSHKLELNDRSRQRGKLRIGNDWNAITIIALYAMYLIATSGIKESTRKIEQKADGTHVETEKIVYHSFSEPVKSAIALFRATAGAALRNGTKKS